MSGMDALAILPLLILAAVAVAAMLSAAFVRNAAFAAWLSVAGLALAAVSVAACADAVPRQITPLLIVDGRTLFFTGLICAAAFAVALLARGYFKSAQGRTQEFFLLLVLATLGAAVLAASNHFASFFLGLEVLSVSLYGLIAYPRMNLSGIEAGVKYLVLAAVSAAFLLFGMALIYAQTGTLQFSRLGPALSAQANGILLVAGLALTIAGFGFKLALVPFHQWTPDVYQGAPAPVTAFVATVSKGAMVALLVRFFEEAGAPLSGALALVFALVAAASMIAGNALALLQKNVKRMLAYSSIAHLGYILVGFLAGGERARTAVAFYLAAYFAATLVAFGTVSVLSRGGGEAEESDDYRALFWRRPWLSGCFTLALLSLAGIPLTLGFVGKFYILFAGVASALWTLVLVLALTSAVGLYYYLRLIVTMFLPPSPDYAESSARASRLSGAVIAVLTVALLVLGIYPTPLLEALTGLFR